MTSIIVTAQRWESKLGGGWELLNGDHAMTQVRRLSDARQQVIDYLDTIDQMSTTGTGISPSSQLSHRHSPSNKQRLRHKTPLMPKQPLPLSPARSLVHCAPQACPLTILPGSWAFPGPESLNWHARNWLFIVRYE